MSANTSVQVYLLAQEHCGLKVGDYVKVMRTAGDHEAGWPNLWFDLMSGALHRVFQIKEINSRGVYLDIYGGCCCFPYFVLEKVEKPAHKFKPFDRVLVRDSDKQIWEPALFTYYTGIRDYPYKVYNVSYRQCIPYEGNEHLTGTTDMPEGGNCEH